LTTTPSGALPSPERIFEALTAFQLTAALKAAIELDLFTGIAQGNDTVKALAEHCHAAERGVRILCDYLVISGFLAKTEDRYALSPISAMYLDRRSPAYLGSIARFLAADASVDTFKEFTASVRNGGATFQPEGTLAPEDPIWVEFARSMAPLMALPAQEIARRIGEFPGKKVKVLDIAAGHGLFGVTIAGRIPTAEIHAVDWPNVLEVARENARSAGVLDRYRSIPGSAFDVNFGSGYDFVLLTNFLHHFDPPTIERLLKKVHAALAAGGSAIALEFVPNEDRISPPIPAKFSLIMLGSTPSGDAYTLTEYRRMFSNAGFSSCELHPIPPSFHSLLIARK
jgi:2-polyprenyl-3-methyl-5-hydroxy-6-metoxy-1,4-benzoquinol methylase